MTFMFALAAGAAASSVLAGGSTFTSYQIGNSLSEDMWRVFPVLAASHEARQSNTYMWGGHFRPGTSITYMSKNPTAASTLSGVGLNGSSLPGTNLTPWNVALPGNPWNAVTMEPYPSYNEVYGSVTLATDTAAINGIISTTRTNASNASTRFFIYGAWPQLAFGKTDSYGKAFDATTIHTQGELGDLSRAYFVDLVDSVRQTNPSASLIPVGEVLYAIDQKMQRGKIPGFTSIEQLHRDAIHLNGLGQNIAAATVYACLFKEDPTGLNYVTMWPDGDKDLSSHLPSAFLDVSGVVAVSDPIKMAALQANLKIMQQTVWEVVNQQSVYTNVPEPLAIGLLSLSGLLLRRPTR